MIFYGVLQIFPCPLVNLQKTMENHHFQWENPLCLWSLSIAMSVIVYKKTMSVNDHSYSIAIGNDHWKCLVSSIDPTISHLRRCLPGPTAHGRGTRGFAHGAPSLSPGAGDVYCEVTRVSLIVIYNYVCLDYIYIYIHTLSHIIPPLSYKYSTILLISHNIP